MQTGLTAIVALLDESPNSDTALARSLAFGQCGRDWLGSITHALVRQVEIPPTFVGPGSERGS